MLTLTPGDNLESAINLTHMLGDRGGSRRKPKHTQADTEKVPSWDSNQEPASCEASMLTTTPPCSLLSTLLGFLDFFFVVIDLLDFFVNSYSISFFFLHFCLVSFCLVPDNFRFQKRQTLCTKELK